MLRKGGLKKLRTKLLSGLLVVTLCAGIYVATKSGTNDHTGEVWPMSVELVAPEVWPTGLIS